MQNKVASMVNENEVLGAINGETESCLEPRQLSISILTVVRNDRAGFVRTARSVLSQKQFRPEWIVIDGASTDGTVDEIESVKDSIDYWHSEADNGVYHAMNLALARATGDYVLFLNAGDCLADDHVVSDVALAIGHADSDIVVGEAILHFPNGLMVLHKPRLPSQIKNGLIANHQATFFRTSLHRRFPHDETFRISSDYLTTAQMISSHASVRCLPRIVAIRDSSPASIGASGGARHYIECIRVQRRVLQLGWIFSVASLARRFVSKRCFHFIAGAQSSATVALARWVFRDRIVDTIHGERVSNLFHEENRLRR